MIPIIMDGESRTKQLQVIRSAESSENSLSDSILVILQQKIGFNCRKTKVWSLLLEYAQARGNYCGTPF